MKRLFVMACLLFLLSFLVDCSAILLQKKPEEIQPPAGAIRTERVVLSVETDAVFL